MPITIVTAFFDIGRAEWAARPNTPAWLARSIDDYFVCFERMSQLENEIVVFTERRFASRILAARARYGHTSKTTIICKDDIFNEHKTEFEKIDRVMKRPDFLAGVTQPYCPEYWEPRYLLINYLKSYFACEAIDNTMTTDNTVAWIDFGYCRDENVLPLSRKWDYPFSDRIHLFNIENLDSQTLISIIKTNKVYFQGCHIVATRAGWFDLRKMIKKSFDTLISFNLIDDDQTMLLMAYRASPSRFETHYVETEKKGWFVAFKDYNIYE